MAIIPGMTVPAPLPLRRRYGLFDAASGPLDLPAHGQGGGARYVPETCGEAYVLSVDCEDPPTKPIDGDAEEIETGVFTVLSTLSCGAPGYSLADMRRKVRTRFEGAEQAAVERALWSGLDLEGNPTGVRSLSGTAVEVTGSNYDPALIADVVAALERYAYSEVGYGYAAYLHAPIEVAAWAAESGLVHEERLTGGQGQRKVTPLGSVWSFGAYPAGEIIVTGQTTVWRAPEVSVVDSFERTTNERLLLAERTYAVSFDCFAGRAEYDPLEVVSP